MIIKNASILLIFFSVVLFVNCAQTSKNTTIANQANSNKIEGSGGTISQNENDAEVKSSPQTGSNSAEKEDNDSATNSNGIESIYTELSIEKCKTIEVNEEEGWSVQECPGVGGYKIQISEGDLRQSISVVAKSGEKWQLDYPGIVSNAFSAFGEKAEWRVRKIDGKVVPIAFITRYNANEDTEKSEKVTSYLVIAKIDDKSACITDVIKPIPNANEKARELADVSADKPCLKNE